MDGARNPYVWACLLVTAGFGLIGWLDDYDKVKKAHHAGLSGKTRLALEFLIAGFATWLIVRHGGTHLYLPFKQGPVLDLGWFYIVFGAFVIVSFGNSVNLTDGLDGLATMPVIIASLAFLAHRLPRRQRALRQLPRHPACARRRRPDGAAAWRSSAPGLPSCGSTRPRRRSSWATPAASHWAARSARSSVATHHEFVLVIVGGLFVSRRCRVIIQVAVYKRTGKRVFLMAPIHHHFEHLGWSEPTVVIRFWIISFVLALAGLATLKLR